MAFGLFQGRKPLSRSKICFTKGQAEAIRAFDQDLCVSAGAGSGKTCVLVERFLWAVTEKGIEPDRVLAITFTDKAANEMKERLIAICRDRGLHKLRRKLDTAYISTIHGFCSRLLKENPIEAGVDPAFSVLAEGEAEILLNRVLDRLFEEGSGNERWISLLVLVGEENLRAAIKKFYGLERALEGENTTIFKSDPMIKEQKKMIDRAEKALGRLGMKERQKALCVEGKSGWDKIDSILIVKEGLRAHGKDKEQISEIKRLIDTCVTLVVQEISHEYKKSFEEIFRKFKEAYEAEKKAMAACDFDDLLVWAHRLLSGASAAQEAVCRRMRNKFTAILVDEYQDTSALQNKIILRIKNKNNLFIVGDRQQSVYGFRWADPEVFDAHLKDPSSRNIRLSENFRSREAILGFVNALFIKIAPSGGFEPLLARREFKTAKAHAVELLCVPRENDLDRARVIEARSIARRIQELNEDGMAYGDIAMIFRGLSKSYLYEKELSDLGIPYVVTKGRGFFEKPEVLDLVNFLKVIENPSEDIALASVLRSPLVAVSDDALFWMAQAKRSLGDEASLSDSFERFEKIQEIPQSDRDKLSRFSRLLGELKARKNSLRLSEILQTASSRTDYEAKILTRPDGVQRLANVRKLWELARELENKNILGIDEFVRYLQNLSEREVTEPEARLAGEKSQAVRLSTIHAAKGLEFGCVIAADLGHGESKNRRDVFLSLPDAGLGMKLPSTTGEKWLKDFDYTRSEEKMSEREDDEEDRLLYVALTRAEDHLILSGAVEADPKTKERVSKPSYIKRVAAAVGWTESAAAGSLPCRLPAGRQGQAGEIEFAGVKIRLCPVRKQAAKKMAARPFDEKKLAALIAETGAESDKFAGRFQQILKPYRETQDHTVTELVAATGLTFLPEKKDAEEGWAQDEEWRTPANEFGTLFHRFMQYLAQGRPKKIAASDFKSPIFERLSADEKTRMREGILGFWHGPWGEAVRRARQCYPELPFIFKTPHGLLKGQIDLVFKTQQGEWVIVDYKTNRITPSQKEAVALGYEMQLALYALAFKKLYGEAPKKSVLYFSALKDTYEIEYKEEAFIRIEEKLESAAVVST